MEILTGEISRGFRLEAERLIVIAEEEIFGRRVKRRGLSEARKKQLLTSLAELKPGDHMVHLDFGVALYRGLEHLGLTGLAVLMATLFNLITDLVGGIRVSVLEEEVLARRGRTPVATAADPASPYQHAHLGLATARRRPGPHPGGGSPRPP